VLWEHTLFIAGKTVRQRSQSKFDGIIIEEFMNRDREGMLLRLTNEKCRGHVATHLCKNGEFLLFYRGKRISRGQYEERLAVRRQKDITILCGIIKM